MSLAGRSWERPGAPGTFGTGNVKYGDIGIYLRDAIRDYFKKNAMEINLKYIDPSYIIRCMPANSRDAAFCLPLGQSAVHAGKDSLSAEGHRPMNRVPALFQGRDLREEIRPEHGEANHSLEMIELNG